MDLTTHSPSLPRARHAEAGFPADAHHGMSSCESKLDFAPFTLSHLPLPLLSDSFVFTLSTQKLSARNSKHTMTKTTSPPPLLALICLFDPIPPPAVVWTLGCFCGDHDSRFPLSRIPLSPARNLARNTVPPLVLEGSYHSCYFQVFPGPIFPSVDHANGVTTVTATGANASSHVGIVLITIDVAADVAEDDAETAVATNADVKESTCSIFSVTAGTAAGEILQ